MRILERRCYTCGRTLPEIWVPVGRNAGTYVITGVARRCPAGHMQQCETADDTAPPGARGGRGGARP